MRTNPQYLQCINEIRLWNLNLSEKLKKVYGHKYKCTKCSNFYNNFNILDGQIGWNMLCTKCGKYTTASLNIEIFSVSCTRDSSEYMNKSFMWYFLLAVSRLFEKLWGFLCKLHLTLILGSSTNNLFLKYITEIIRHQNVWRPTRVCTEHSGRWSVWGTDIETTHNL
jgi:hypothetical protein